MKKYFVLKIVLIIVMLFALGSKVYATDMNRTLTQEQIEDETHHFQEHANADQFYRDQQYTTIIVMCGAIITSIVFYIISKNNKKTKVLMVYLILLIFWICIYGLSNIYIIKKYPSRFAALPVEEYTLIPFVIVNIFVGFAVKENRKCLLFSIIPAILAFIVMIGYLYCNILEGIMNALIIWLISQIILMPVYSIRKKIIN